MYADTKPFVYNYEKCVVLLMVMEHAANKLLKKKLQLPIICDPHATYTMLRILTAVFPVLMGADIPNRAALASFFASPDSSTPNFCARISKRC